MPAVRLCVVGAVILIFCVPSNPTPFICLTVLSAVAVSAFPFRAPLTKYAELSVMPVSTVVNPVIAALESIVNVFVDTIPTAMSATVIIITG